MPKRPEILTTIARSIATLAAVAVLALVLAPKLAVSREQFTKRDITVFLAAAAANRFGVVVQFLDRGMDPDVAGKNGYTALILAAGSRARSVVKLLLQRGADPDKANDRGWPAMAILPPSSGRRSRAPPLFGLIE